jgi:hypothetical protein
MRNCPVDGDDHFAAACSSFVTAAARAVAIGKLHLQDTDRWQFRERVIVGSRTRTVRDPLSCAVPDEDFEITTRSA